LMMIARITNIPFMILTWNSQVDSKRYQPPAINS
jgi:hypothetical protein